MITIRTGAAGFLNEFGIGPFATYGQPLMNAYACAVSGAATLHCLKVTAPDATYSAINIVAKYKTTKREVDGFEEVPDPSKPQGMIEEEYEELVEVPQDDLIVDDFGWVDFDIGDDEPTLQGDGIDTRVHPDDPDPSDPTMFQKYVKIGEHAEPQPSIWETQVFTRLVPDPLKPQGTMIVPSLVNRDELDIKFQAVPFEIGLGDLSLLTSYEPGRGVDEDGYTTVKLFSLAYLGRGAWGDNIRFRILSNASADKENQYKNYILEIYEFDEGMTKKEDYAFAISPDAEYSGISIFVDALTDDPDDGSDLIKFISYPEGFEKIINVYNSINDESIYTMDNFDFFFGVSKFDREEIPQYNIIPGIDNISVLDIMGIPLKGGYDGTFEPATATKPSTLERLYVNAYSGAIDPMIKSKNKYPTNLILDANFPIPVKQLIAALATIRTDCVAILDCGVGITTKGSVLTYVKSNLDAYVSNRVQTVEAYAGKVKDPYNGKIVTVTGTYGLASGYPIHFQNNGAKHVPLAGNIYGNIVGFIRNTIYPLFDEDIDAMMMDDLVENNINFARINARQNVIRAIQNTRQIKLSALSDVNNVFVLLDIKRDCEILCATYEYNFMEPTDIARFNTDAEMMLSGYRDAQVRSLGVYFGSNEWEAPRGYLHMYVEFAVKDMVKTTIIEIDVTRG
jgi:hypothetical protein